MENIKTNEVITEKKPHEYDGRTIRTSQKENKRWISSGRISWPAIFAGVIVTAVAQMLFSLLGIGIGLAAVDPLAGRDEANGLGAGTIAWWSVTMLAALFLGGWTTGKLYAGRTRMEISMHGLLTWCAFTIVSFFMLTTSVGKLLSGAGNIVGTMITAGAAAVPDNTRGELDLSDLTRDARNLFFGRNTGDVNNTGTRSGNNNTGNNNTGTDMSGNMSGQTGTGTSGTGGNVSGQTGTGNINSGGTGYHGRNDMSGMTGTGQTGTAQTGTGGQGNTGYQSNMGVQQGGTAYGGNMNNGEAFAGEVESFFKDGDVTPEARERLVNAIVQQTGLSRSEANARADKWINDYQELKANAREKADQAAKAASTASIIAFFALLLGAVVTIFGARAAIPKSELITVRSTTTLP